MRILELTCCLSQLDAVVTLRPGPGDGSPEISWDDLFFYYSPDGSVPTTTQPFATIVTKDYPGFDESSRLDRPDTYRVNVAAGREAFIQWVGRAPRDPAAGDPSTPDPEHPTWSSRTRCTASSAGSAW